MTFRKQAIATLKAYRDQGYALEVKLNATNQALYDELVRIDNLLKAQAKLIESQLENEAITCIHPTDEEMEAYYQGQEEYYQSMNVVENDPRLKPKGNDSDDDNSTPPPTTPPVIHSFKDMLKASKTLKPYAKAARNLSKRAIEAIKAESSEFLLYCVVIALTFIDTFLATAQWTLAKGEEAGSSLGGLIFKATMAEVWEFVRFSDRHSKALDLLFCLA